MALRDMNDIVICVGDTVRSSQYSGGVFRPAPPVIGEVVFKDERFMLKYRINGQEFDSFLLLDNTINEIVSKKVVVSK